MYDFLFFTISGYIFFDLVRLYLIKHQNSYLHIGYYLSIIHASLLVLVHSSLLFYFDASNFHLITLHNMCLGWNFSYAIVDLRNMYDTGLDYIQTEGSPPSYKKLRYFASMVFHHILMMILALLSMWTINYDNLSYGFYVSLGYLTEVSTPILNYIQLYQSATPPWCKILFAFIFFWCRPVNLTYIWYHGGYKSYGLLSPFSIGIAAVAALNYYWFYKIYLRGKRMIEEIKDEHGLTLPDVLDK